MDKGEVLKQIGRSGFPFQLGVEDAIRRTQSSHRWLVASREHPWSTEDTESSGFIDLVLQHMDLVTHRIVVECKRVKADDQRQLQWFFLVPEVAKEETALASCLEVGAAPIARGKVEGTNTGRNEWDYPQMWEGVNVLPRCLESSFCVLAGDDQKRQPLLEQLASDVIESVEGLASEEKRIHQSRYADGSARSGIGRLLVLLFPFIVTNAEIAICRFDPSDVNILDGTLPASATTVEAVPYIRFRKSLATTFPEGAFDNLRKANAARERTVFVVNAQALPALLEAWQVSPLGIIGRYAIQKYI